MMNNNNHHPKNCSFAEEIVAYIYGEIGANEKNAFENHLAKCANCADDAAEFANVSLAVGAWRDSEFSQIKTPQIEIPYETNEQVSVSWLAGLREFFARTTAWTTAAATMAAVIVCVGLVFVAVKYSNNDDLAGLDNKNSVIPIVSPTPEIIKNPSKEIADSAPKSAPETLANVPNDTVQTELKDVKSKNKNIQTVVKIAEPPTPKVVRLDGDTIVPVNPNKLNTANKPKAKSVTNKSVPTLNNFEEDEDDSLRLADMLDEIDTEK